jgi:glutamate-ammonia-ligase adenylyltransferase
MYSPALDTISTLPSASNLDEASRVWMSWRQQADADATAIVENLYTHPVMRQLIDALAGNSPYLARLLSRHLVIVQSFATEGASQAFAHILSSLSPALVAPLSQAEAMRTLRVAKAQAALLVALADVSGVWDVATVTRQLSIFAQVALETAFHWLLTHAIRKGEFSALIPDTPSIDSHIIILGMGKLGAYELNYSSDIDLIVLFDTDRVPYAGSQGVQRFVSRLAQDLVHLLQERTQDGYVFRTDLRLRPDPMSTPPAVSTLAALHYYETVGQNWERAAMIKARPIAGDIQAGEYFLRELTPYIWRKYLDFAAIADIHSIKRQMNITSGKDITLYGHNIKTGAGGIREIEFFVQTQQLVWGGRLPHLRGRGTLMGLESLCQAGLIGTATRDALTTSYLWFRKVEHALQMRNDEQTHSLPTTAEGIEWLRIFLGYSSADSFSAECLSHLQSVHRYYLDSMEGGNPLSAGGNLVFTGVEADPETLKTLEAMGYRESRAVSDIIQNWHRGSRKSTRSKRSRQVLTELVPQILKKLSETANPDAAFFHFDDFLAKLPSGAQIFSLFAVRPELLTLVADVLGSAPALADTMSREPTLLDAVLEPDFYGTLPSREEMIAQLSERVRHAHEYEQRMTVLRIFNNDKRFQAGVQMLNQQITPQAAGAFLSDLAEAVLDVTLRSIHGDLCRNYPPLADAQFAVLGLGKLGAREMSFGSDLDMVFLYEDSSDDLELRTQIHRLSQRLITALTLMTREGRLYEVDTRLRPGGADGPLATSISGFNRYFTDSAWTFELQALSKARVISASHAPFKQAIETIIASHIVKPRDTKNIVHDIADMRERIAREHTTRNPWAVKYVRGGLVDCEFIAQMLVLTHANTHPDIWQPDSIGVFTHAMHAGIIPEAHGKTFIEAMRFLSDLLSVSRLMSEDILTDDTMSQGLKRSLAAMMKLHQFDDVKQRLLAHEEQVRLLYDHYITLNTKCHPE